MRAEIIAVGTELLSPSRQDTNSLFITERLNGIGIEVGAKCIVGDDPATLSTVFVQALERADLVILTGGLGPTDDDVTRDVVAGALRLPLEEDVGVVERIRQRFAARGWRMPEINRRQAMVPRGAVMLDNANGTAPGLWIEQGPKAIALLPGPPREMMPMMDVLARDRLAPRAGGARLFRRILRITGRSESHVDEAVHPLTAHWITDPTPVSTTILASFGQVELHLSARAYDECQAVERLERCVMELRGVLGVDLYSWDGRTMEEVVGDLLKSRGLHIAAAESCTGGLLTSRLTDVPGSSAYVERAAVTYSDASKSEMIGVPPDLIAEQGAVSEPVALAMASGIRDTARVQIGVGITGIAGPGGGSARKPVGTVAIAAVWEGRSRTKTFHFMGGREMVKFQASQAALDMVRRMLINAEFGMRKAE
jgi:nicotinamide-nucleotide amidase